MTSTTKTESKSPARTSWPTTKPRLNRRGLVIHIAWCGKKAGYGVVVLPLEQIIVTPLARLDSIDEDDHCSLVPL